MSVGDPKLRVAVVDDSMFIRKAIIRMLEDSSDIEVVGSAGSGEELLTHFDTWRPDVVTLDLDMPGMGGLATLDRLRELRPTPVIILSTHSGEGAPQTIEALHRGATDFIDKQRYSLVDFEALRSVLMEKIFLVTGRSTATEASAEDPPGSQKEKTSRGEKKSYWSRRSENQRQESHPPSGSTTPVQTSEGRTQGRSHQEDRTEDASRGAGAFDLVVIGASTGGPPILQEILEALGGSLPIPIVIVQHMPLGFTSAFAERLNAYLPLHVREAQPAEHLLPDTVYIASAGTHVRIRKKGLDLFAELSPQPDHLVHIPSIDILFESAAREVGRHTIGVILTGMGRDGAAGLAALRHRDAYTLCQDEDSCVVFGMPRAALALNAVREIATPPEIGRRLGELIHMAEREPPAGSTRKTS